MALVTKRVRNYRVEHLPSTDPDCLKHGPKPTNRNGAYYCPGCKSEAHRKKCPHGSPGVRACGECRRASSRAAYRRKRDANTRPCACGCGRRVTFSCDTGYAKGHNPICDQGHDKREVGVESDGKCSVCRKEWYGRRYWERQRNNPRYKARQTATARDRYRTMKAKAEAYDELMRLLEPQETMTA